ncbi:peptide methionine sulfoxide reductase-like [Uranotaenia lowii]|uniref:peptide methionine sulfoxide reductase-like n=1 Tax=Uranotaenia lowii TaxID=190385 RepID=UPI002478E2EF|nr:peptide methionine sulfoxide reductase-like [Uranotaenia lowii]
MATTGPLHQVDTPYEVATLGMGCYWGSDSLFGATKGILRTRVGYAGGTTGAPQGKNIGDNVEVIELHYDPSVISYSKLLDIFWKNHEYLASARLKREYMSMIMYHSEDQRKLAEESKITQQKKETDDQIVTEIVPSSEFYPAQDHNQKYRLQGHVDLAKTLNLTTDLLQTSHVAARLNGFLGGAGSLEQFELESQHLNLSPEQIQYVKNFLIENPDMGISC